MTALAEQFGEQLPQIDEAKNMSTPRVHVTVPCNTCHASDFTVLYPAGVAQLNQIVKCNHCDLMYASPRKDADHVDMESSPDDPSADLETWNPQRYEKERLQVRDYENTRKLLRRLYPAGGKLLEVGSSLGYLLDRFRTDGFDVQGVEPDRFASRHAARDMGIPTINSTLEGAQIPSESVDVVVMLHVIEHVPNPVGTLREIHRILRPGGHLVLETPRYDTLMFKLLGRRERSLSCDGHIFFFTTASLKRAYSTAGFELERAEFPGRSLTLDRLAYNVGVMSKSQAVQRAVRTLSRRAVLHKVRLTLNARDMQRVCLRKRLSA
jgi:2-polyprenyl-3-methyl-5-hydroxy-6-metoxy-1,4-benzoquinol methylase